MYSTKRLKLFLIKLGQPAIAISAGVIFSVSILLYKLGSLVPGYSQSEVNQLKSQPSLNSIINNPLNAPYKLLHYSLNHLHLHSLYSARGVSALAAVISIGLFYYIVSRWQSTLTASLSTFLYTTSAWFLHYARLATSDIFLCLLVVTLAYGTWIRRSQRSALVLLVGVLVVVTLVYIPGLVWFVVIGGLWQGRAIFEHLKKAKLTFTPIALLGVLLILPLLAALIRQPSLARILLGIPSKLPNPYNYFRQVLNVPFQIFLKGPSSPTIWLSRLPLLDIFTAAMCLLGFYAYSLKLKLDRGKILFGILIIGTLLVGLHGSVTTIILLPAIYLLVAAGIDYMLSQWFHVFPRNPLARIIALSLMTVLVLLSGYYNSRQYFVAWPNDPVTKKVFEQRP